MLDIASYHRSEACILIHWQDHFSIPPGAGFPDHPHRGQETITYLLSGSVDHEDFAGHKGTIETGDLQVRD